MKNILVDLDVVLDVLFDRAPFADDAAALWTVIEIGEANGLVAAHAVATLHYLATRSGGRSFADRCVSDVLEVFGIAPEDEEVVKAALAMKWADFEDALSTTAALAAGCNMIATRDPKGFQKAPLAVLGPKGARLAVERSAR